MLRAAALATTGVLAFGAAGAAATYSQVRGGIDTVDVSALVGEKPTQTPDPEDPNAGNAINVLILGSDQRDGENGDIGGDFAGMRSDTAIVMHVSADRDRIELVSIPRDSLVDVPQCTMTDGSTTGAYNGMFNSAFATGADQGGDVASAAACTMRTVYENTGVWIDHYMVVDFVGFIDMVDAIGGVPMCIENDIDAPKADLKLTAGYQTLDGRQALGFARARTGEGLGDGSDITRLGRQQQLISATVREVMSKNVVTDVPQLIRFLSAATSSLTMDPAFSSDLTGLAYSLRNVRSGNITFMTIPWGTAPNDPNRVVWTAEADAVWAAMVADEPIVPESEPEPSADPSSSASASASATPTPTQTKEPGKEAFSPDDVTEVCG